MSTKQTFEFTGKVNSTDQYNNPTVIGSNGHTTLNAVFKISQFSDEVDNFLVGDNVLITASTGKDGTFWIDKLTNLTESRGRMEIERRPSRWQRTARPGWTPAQHTPGPPLNSAAAQDQQETQQMVQVGSNHHYVVLKAFEIAFNYMKDDSDADESDAIALAGRLVQAMEAAGA